MKQLVPLYGRVPAGVGTPLVESLTGFVSRLAMARHLSLWSIFKRLVCPLVSEDLKGQERGHGYWARGFAGRNGIIWDGDGEHMEALVDALAELTGLEHLSWHTLLPLKELLPVETRGILFLYSVYGKRWCASCLARWRRKGMEPWEPLLWRISFVRCCPIHNSVLSQVCGTYKKPQGFISDRVPFGFCRECGRHVEIGDPLILKRRERTPAVGRWEWELSRAVGNMLASQKVLEEFASGRGFVHLLSSLRRHPQLGSSRFVARHIGSTPASVKKWLEDEKRPRLLAFLRICIRAGVDPLAVAIYPHGKSFEVDSDLRFGIQPEKKRYRVGEAPCRKWGATEWDKVKSSLVELLESPEAGLDPAVSVARRLGVDPSTVKKHCPEEYAALKEARAAWRLKDRERRLAKQDDALRASFAECLRKGLYPSMPRVFEGAGLPTALYLDERCRELFQELRRNAGFP